MTHSALPPAAAAVEAWAQQAAMCVRKYPFNVEPNVWRPRTLRDTVDVRGVRRAVVLLAGSERRFWAGEYGCKFAAPVLRFVAPRVRGWQAARD